MTTPSSPGNQVSNPPGPWLLALWFGLAGGLLEAIRFLYVRFVQGEFTKLSTDVAWMAPIAVTVPLLGAAAVLWPVWRRWSGQQRMRAAVSVYAALVTFGLLLFAGRLHVAARWVLAIGIGVQLGLVVSRHARGFGRLVRFTLPALVVTELAMLFAVRGVRFAQESWRLSHLAAAPSGAPSVLLIVMDATRASELSVYGYQRHTTPMLERLARRGVLFERAVSPSPWTLPSHASMFTGHDARDLNATWRTPLDGAQPTLAEVLTQRGYYTAGFAANLQYTSRESGLNRGFEYYDGAHVTAGTIARSGALLKSLVWLVRSRGLNGPLWRKNAGVMRSNVVDWLGAHQGRPYFAFINLYDAHDPYLPPRGWDTLFAEKAPLADRSLSLHQERLISPAEALIERNAYDQSIAYMDHEIGGLLDDLEQRGLLRNTIVMVTADHGEEFGEHGLLQHGNSLYMQSLHVPFIVSWPGHIPEGGRVPETIGMRNIAATILDMIGAPPSLPGMSLAPLWSEPANRTPPLPPAIAEVRLSGGHPRWMPISRGDLSAGITDRLQVIRLGKSAVAVYDLKADPLGGTSMPDTGTAVQELIEQTPLPRK